MSADDPSSGQRDDLAASPVGTAGPADMASANDGNEPGLIEAVDALEAVSTEPVHAHAAQYHEVHTLFQDALSATDRPGT